MKTTKLQSNIFKLILDRKSDRYQSKVFNQVSTDPISFYLDRLLKKEQLELFGYYFGKGSININERTREITHVTTVAYGKDLIVTASMDFDGLLHYDYSNRTKFNGSKEHINTPIQITEV